MPFNWTRLGIDVGRIRTEGKTKCPKCGPTRKNKNDKSLSVNVETGDYKCHNTPCDFMGNAGYDDKLHIQREKKVFVKPLPKLQKVSDGVLKWFESRGISNNTLLTMKITESNEWMPQDQQHHKTICFNYFRNGELINIKHRTREKFFKLEKDAELIFYNLDCLLTPREFIIITEGEVDELTFVECGFYGVLSVPNGTSKGVNTKLEYVDNCWRELENVSKIVIATDGDEAGEILKQELIRRLGAERCASVKYPAGCKDANETMLLGCKNVQELVEKHGIEGIAQGKEAVKNLILTAKYVPIDGVLMLDDVKEQALAIFNYGYPQTLKIGWELDKYITWRMGEATVVTGIPNHGKSTWLNSLIIELAVQHDWVIAIFSPEKNPIEFLVSELAAIYIGESYYRTDPHQKMSIEQWNHAMDFIANHFLFIKAEDDITLDEFLITCDRLVKRFGINGVVADPWNYFEHDQQPFQSETQYISIQLGKISKWVKRANVHLWLVAHPTKMEMDKKTFTEMKPRLYNISGSAHWKNKIDNGIIVYRNYKSGTTEIIVEKVRWFFVGHGGGKVEMIYDNTSLRFRDKPPVIDLSPEQATYEEKKANQAIAARGRELLFPEPPQQTTLFNTDSKDDLPF